MDFQLSGKDVRKIITEHLWPRKTSCAENSVSSCFDI